MNVRLQQNKNESRYIDQSYKGLHVYADKGPLVLKYLEDIFRVIECALSDWPKVFAFRFDLHLPKGSSDWPEDVMSRFVQSFEAKIYAYLRRHGIPLSACKPKLFWAKERDSVDNPHFHCFVLLDGDLFCSSDVIYNDGWSLKKCVESAWASALKMSLDDSGGLARFLPNGDYEVDRDEEDFLQQITNLFYRASYLAKEATKQYGNSKRTFSRSCLTSLQYGFDLEEILSIHKWLNWGMKNSETLNSSELTDRWGNNTQPLTKAKQKNSSYLWRA